MTRQWLNPADHFTLLMDHQIRASGLAGNYCALVLELDGVADGAMIAQRCAELAQRLPLSVARLAPQGRRYHWLPSGNSVLPFITARLDTEPDDGAAHPQVLDIVNTAQEQEASAPFELHLLQGDERALLVLRWFHPATDAKGAELLLHHLFADAPCRQPPQPSPVRRLLQQWSWWHKFVLARRAVANVRALDRHASALPRGSMADPQRPESSPPQRRLACQRVRYGREQTRQILANAREQAGITGITLYLIGCMMRALEHTAVASGGDGYCVPYAANLRRRNALTPIFGNQVGFLFAQAGREQLGSRRRLFTHLREQHKQAVRGELDQAMLPLMQAGSWLPLQRYARIVRESPQRRERSSFWFSYTGEMQPRPQQVGGCALRGLYQVSPVTVPPGLGLLVSLFDGRLALSYCHVEDVIDAEGIERLSAAMTLELLNHDR